jgi:hypothetical protein
LTGTPNFIDDKNSVAETADVGAIAHLVIANHSANIRVIADDNPRLEVRSFSGDLLKQIKYELSGDTLKLTGMRTEENRKFKITVFVPRTNFHTMNVNSSSVSVDGLELKELRISQKSANIWMSDCRIKKLQMTASGQSYLELSSSVVDVLSAELHSSQVVLSSPIELLEGSMEQASFMRVTEVSDIQFKKDESSTLNLFK